MPSASKRLLQQRELGLQVWVDALARLVAGPQVVTEGLNDVVCRNAQVRRTVLGERQDGRQHTLDCAHLAALRIAHGRPRIEVAEQLVGAVDQVNLHVQPA